MKNYKIKSSIAPRFLLAISMLLILVGAAEVSAQTDKSGEVKSKQDVQEVKLTAKKGTGKKDVNLKSGKRKPKPRGSGDMVCNIEIKNNTPYIIGIYVDDRQKGFAAANGSFKITDDTGRMKIYARTDLLKNKFLYWGPNYFTCGSGSKDGFILLEINLR